jgi:RNA polymerase sigma-70 factor (ECF subfamily)
VDDDVTALPALDTLRPVGFEGSLVELRGPVDFEDFYRREYRSVVGLAYALSGSRWVAEDIAQEAFVAAHRRWEVIGTFDQPGYWVRRVVSNLAVSAIRRRMVEAKALARLALGRHEPLPELEPADHEFWKAVRSLPRRQAQAITLHYLEDLPVTEIAAVLDCAEGTVKALLHKGRRSLFLRLGEQEDR